jgi:hypothetical protein
MIKLQSLIKENQQKANELLQLAKSLDLTKKSDRDKFKNAAAKTIESHASEKKEQSVAISKRKLSPLQIAYREFFINLLNIYGANSPAELSDNDKKDFFNDIRNKWKYQRTKFKKENNLLERTMKF